MRLLTQDLRKTHLPTYRYRYVWENWRRECTAGPPSRPNIYNLKKQLAVAQSET
jgi:hypothetical protein